MIDILRINLPRPVQYAMKSLEGAGYQAYIVGGSVRDVLLGKEPNDYDITTSALPDEMTALFRKDRLLTNGLKHGTLTLIKYGTPVEMTTFRIDGEYEDGRHPDEVIFTGNLFEDVQRRDFTVNALCWNEQAGLIDYVGGEEDIEKRIIRCVGEPDVRFGEDALRILRALRFSAALDFDIDPPTAQSVHKNRALLSQIAVERVLTELKKLICGPRAEGVLMEYRDVFEVFMPELGALTPDEYALAARQVSLISPVPELRLAALMGDLDRDAALEAARRLKFSRQSRNFIDGIIEHRAETVPLDRAGMRRRFNQLGEELASGLVEYQSARTRALTHMVIQQGDCVSLRQLAVKGDDVFAAGVTRRQTGQCLSGLLEGVMAGRLPNEKEALLNAVRERLASRGEMKAGSRARRRPKREETGDRE